MGLQLWYSKTTGIRRKGTTFSELQDIFIDDITTRYIYEPLACCRITDNIHNVKDILNQMDFDSLGVINENEEKIGYIVRDVLGENDVQQYLNEFSLSEIISESTPLSELFEILMDKEFIYVLKGDSIEGIVTRADINKPIVRIYLFGLISLYELHLNYWINELHSENSWMDILNNQRIELADKTFQERKGNNFQLTLLECLQICDKREILRGTEVFLKRFEYSKTKFKRLLENIEKIRNELAHSQNSIISNLDWKEFVKSLKLVKGFLIQSEKLIEK